MPSLTKPCPAKLLSQVSRPPGIHDQKSTRVRANAGQCGHAPHFLKPLALERSGAKPGTVLGVHLKSGVDVLNRFRQHQRVLRVPLAEVADDLPLASFEELTEL